VVNFPLPQDPRRNRNRDFGGGGSRGLERGPKTLNLGGHSLRFESCGRGPALRTFRESASPWSLPKYLSLLVEKRERRRRCCFFGAGSGYFAIGRSGSVGGVPKSCTRTRCSISGFLTITEIVNWPRARSATQSLSRNALKAWATAS
jgi:hypothetical protein